MLRELQELLSEDERVVAEAGKHAVTVLWPLLFLVPAAVGYAEVRPVLLMLNFSFVGIALIYTAILRGSAGVAITDRRLLARWGFIDRHALDLPLERIRDADVRASALARALGYGTLVLRTTDGREHRLRWIAAPDRLVRALRESRPAVGSPR